MWIKYHVTSCKLKSQIMISDSKKLNHGSEVHFNINWEIRKILE